MLDVRHLHQSLRASFPTRASEWAIGLMLFGWALLVQANDMAWLQRDACRVMIDVMPAGLWVAAAMVVGGARLTILFVNGLWRRSPHARAATAFLSGGVWFFVSMSYAVNGAWSTPELAIYPVLCLLDVVNVFRITDEAAVSDDAYRRAARHVGT